MRDDARDRFELPESDVLWYQLADVIAEVNGVVWSKNPYELEDLNRARLAATGADEELIDAYLAGGEPWDEVVAYPPNQVFIGNLTPDDLAEIPRPWTDQPVVGASPLGPFGRIVTQEALYGLMMICDDFELLTITESLAAEARDRLLALGDPALGELMELRADSDPQVIRQLVQRKRRVFRELVEERGDGGSHFVGRNSGTYQLGGRSQDNEILKREEILASSADRGCERAVGDQRTNLPGRQVEHVAYLAHRIAAFWDRRAVRRHHPQCSSSALISLRLLASSPESPKRPSSPAFAGRSSTRLSPKRPSWSAFAFALQAKLPSCRRCRLPHRGWP